LRGKEKKVVDSKEIAFKKINQKDWEKYPEPQIVKPVNKWNEVLDVLQAGDIVEIPVANEKLKGVRIGLARAAAADNRRFKLEFRYTDGKLAVRKGVDLPPREEKESKERKPRTKKTATMTDEETE
jgi:hypothetical protein